VLPDHVFVHVTIGAAREQRRAKPRVFSEFFGALQGLLGTGNASMKLLCPRMAMIHAKTNQLVRIEVRLGIIQMQQHLRDVPVCSRLAKLDLPSLVIRWHKCSVPQFTSQRCLSTIARMLSVLVPEDHKMSGD